MTGHRVPLLGVARRHPDPEHSGDPAVRALVTALATLPAPRPRAHFRAELRAQLVAVAPRLVAEAREEAATTAGTPAAEPRRAHLRVAAGLRIAVGALAACVVLLAGAVWLSRGAVPGDTLYGLKRASENAQLALASDPGERASELLSFAKTRADEVAELLSQPSATAAGPLAGTALGGGRATLVRSTLASADTDLRQASQLLGNQAVQNRSGAPLEILLQWAPGQQERLDAIVNRIPPGELHQDAHASADLVAAAVARARALQANVGCGCLGGAGSDSLGPLPCGPCLSRSTGPTTPAPSPHPSGSSPARPGTQPAPGSTPSPSATSGGAGTNPAGTGSPAPSGQSSTGGGLLPPPPPPTTVTILPPLISPSGTCKPVLQLGPISIGCGVALTI